MIEKLQKLFALGSPNTHFVYPPVALAVVIVLKEILLQFHISFSDIFFDALAVIITSIVGYFTPPSKSPQ